MRKRIEILIIDDEPSVADALRLILEEHGYAAVAVATAAHGLKQAGERQWDVVITDLRLPDMTGFDVLTQIRQDHPFGPAVIVISAYATPQLIAEAMSLGAVDVLLKPFSPSTLLSAIQEALSRRCAIG